MNCKKCGFQLTEGDVFCKNCGEAVTPATEQNNNVSNQVNNTVNNEPVAEKTETVENNVVNNQPTNVVNQNGFNQGPMNQPINNAPIGNMQPVYYNQGPKSNGSLYIIIALVLIIVIGGVLFATGALGGKGGDGGSSGSGPTPETTPNTVSKATYTVKHKGYSFSVPTDVLYSFKDDNLVLGDDTTWIAYIDVVDVQYAKLKANKEQIATNIITSGPNVTVKAPQVKALSGKEAIVYEINDSGNNSILAYTRADESNSFYVEVFRDDNSADYDLLNDVAAIIATAKKSSQSASISPKSNINAAKAALDAVK